MAKKSLNLVIRKTRGFGSAELGRMCIEVARKE